MDSLNHQVRHTPFDEVDVCMSLAVTCHLADPVHHLTFLCSKARKAVFFWCPVNHRDDLSMSFGEPGRYQNSLSYPVSFDNTVRLSAPLIRLTLEKCGFGNITEMPVPENISPEFQNWVREQQGFFAVRTATPATTIYTGGRKNREVPPDARVRKPALKWAWGLVRRTVWAIRAQAAERRAA